MSPGWGCRRAGGTRPLAVCDHPTQSPLLGDEADALTTGLSSLPTSPPSAAACCSWVSCCPPPASSSGSCACGALCWRSMSPRPPRAGAAAGRRMVLWRSRSMCPDLWISATSPCPPWRPCGHSRWREAAALWESDCESWGCLNNVFLQPIELPALLPIGRQITSSFLPVQILLIPHPFFNVAHSVS